MDRSSSPTPILQKMMTYSRNLRNLNAASNNYVLPSSTCISCALLYIWRCNKTSSRHTCTCLPARTSIIITRMFYYLTACMAPLSIVAIYRH
jgi:hypothetical protein